MNFTWKTVKKPPIPITYIKQPEDSPLCVPTVIAMLTGGTIEEMLDHFQTEPRGFYVPEILHFLRHKGVKVKERKTKYQWINDLHYLNKRAVVIAPSHFESPAVGRHCLLWDGNRIIDPLDPESLTLSESWLGIKTEHVFEVID